MHVKVGFGMRQERTQSEPMLLGDENQVTDPGLRLKSDSRL